MTPALLIPRRDFSFTYQFLSTDEIDWSYTTCSFSWDRLGHCNTVDHMKEDWRSR